MTSRRVALVTGSSRGLGLAIAQGLGKRGLAVVVTGRSEAAAQNAADRLRAEDLPEVIPHQLDVSDPASVYRVFAETERAFGRLDILVNNAGLAIDRHYQPSTSDMERVATTIGTNVLGAWRCTIEALRLMRVGGYGRVVNISSGMGSLTSMKSNSPAYRVSKAALNALTCCFADEVAEENILINAVSPGVVNTRMNYGAAAQDPASAAESLLWLATAAEDGPRGRFFEGERQIPW